MKRLVIACPKCGNKLGVPGDRSTLKIACPACSHQFEWRPDAAEAASQPTISEAEYLRLAARLVTGTLIGEMMRADGPGGALQGTVDPERIAGTSFLAGRKVFGEAYTRALVEDAVRWSTDDFRNCLERLSTEDLFLRAKAGCSVEQKDKLVLAALTALELCIDNIGVELLKFRAFGHLLYDTPVECDQRMIMHGGTSAALYPRAIELTNEIIRELNAGASGTPAPEKPAPKREQKPARNTGKGLSILIVCALIAMVSIKFGVQHVENPPIWLALGGFVLSIVFYYWVYRGFRLMTGAGVWVSVFLTIIGFPLLFAVLLFLIGEILPLFENDGSIFADLSPGRDLSSQNIGNGNYFSTFNAVHPNAAELDELMENS